MWDTVICSSSCWQKSRWQFITVISCIWSFHLHLVPPAKCKWFLLPLAVSDSQLASFSNIFAFCYCHKMQVGTADCGTRSFAFLAADKKQMAIHNGYLLHLVIPSAFRAARKMQVVSFAFSPFRQETQLVSFSNIFAFCYCHKMQLGTLDHGKGPFAFLEQKHLSLHKDHFLHAGILFAF